MDPESLRPRIIEILRASDLASVSTKAVRKQLQQETAINLDEYKKPLNTLIAQCFDEISQEASDQASSDSDDDTSTPLSQQVQKSTTSSHGTVKKAAPKRKAESPKKVTKKPRKPRQQDPEKREQNAFTRTWVLSDDLSAVTGEKELSRPKVVKHLWQYIKANNLQDPEKKTHIKCDDKLTHLFEGETYISSFAMNKFIGKHLLRPAVVDSSSPQPATPDATATDTATMPI